MRTISKVLGVAILLLTFCTIGFSQEEADDETESVGGFYFPDWDLQSRNDYVGVFPVSRRSGYYVFRAGQPAQRVGEISGSPFVFHSGPQYCGWIGLPGFGWFGCGPHPFPRVTGEMSVLESPSRSTESIRLREGMGKGEVLDSVGSPIKKILLSRKEIWEYKRYSLVFESGALKEIR